MLQRKNPNEGEKKYTFDDVVEILEVLRGENGCPWDKEQTHESIRGNAVEEAYELADAIDEGEPGHITEEVGDLLLQCVFHTEIAKSNGEFGYDDVFSFLCNKLISRHTHIFGTDKAADAEQALDTWEKNKKAKYGVSTTTEYMKKIPKTMPALTYGEKIQKRAAKVGFDWFEIGPVYQKISEELEEVKAAAPDKKEEELGDLLFAVVNLCRFMNVDPEIALNRANNKFLRRFEFIETKLAEKGKPCLDSDLAEMDKLWEESKEQGL